MTLRYSNLTGRVVDDRPTLRLHSDNHLAQILEALSERARACADKDRCPTFDYATVERRFLDLLDRSQMRKPR